MESTCRAIIPVSYTRFNINDNERSELPSQDNNRTFFTQDSIFSILKSYYVSLSYEFEDKIEKEVKKLKEVSRLFNDLMSYIERTTVIVKAPKEFAFIIEAKNWNIARFRYGCTGLPVL